MLFAEHQTNVVFMNKDLKQKDCCHLVTEKTFRKSITTFGKRYSSVLGIIILLLPKCPFCVVAWSSAITICSSTSLITNTSHHTGWGAYLALSMAMIIISCILFTYKSNPNSIALLAAICGLALVSVGIFTDNAMFYYYWGATVLVIATIIYSDLFKRLFECQTDCVRQTGPRDRTDREKTRAAGIAG